MSSENIAFCLERRKQERKAFLKVMRAVPQDKRDYKHDPKSRSAAELAWVIAAEEAALVKVLDTGTVEWADTPPPATIEEIVAVYEKNAQVIDERLAKMDVAGWEKPAAFTMGGKPVWEDTVGHFLWGFLFDTVHHRGQLSTYLRPMGSKVPAIYGPSADENG